MTQTVGEIAEKIGALVAGDATIKVDAPREPGKAGPNDLALAMDPSYAEALATSAARTAVLWSGADWQSLNLKAAIFVERPRYAMSGVTAAFDAPRQLLKGSFSQMVIDPTALIAHDAELGAFITIARGAKIGTGTRIYPHVSIAQNARIGDNVTIYEGAVIGPNVEIGDNVIIHQRAVIGIDGFSFVTPEPGAIDAFKSGQIDKTAQSAQAYARIASLGSVKIAQDVEIGAGVTIDRGTVADTTVAQGTKIDNQVHIGHNVTVGAHCLLCGQVGIAGSSKIGDRVVLGGQAGVADHITIGNDVIVAGAAGVSSNVPPNRVMMGNPAIPMAANIESYKHYRRLPRLAAKIEELQKLVSNVTAKR